MNPQEKTKVVEIVKEVEKFIPSQDNQNNFVKPNLARTHLHQVILVIIFLQIKPIPLAINLQMIIKTSN